MPEPDLRDGEPTAAELANALDAALDRAGITTTADQRARALVAVRRLRTAVALLRAWNAENDPDPA